MRVKVVAGNQCRRQYCLQKYTWEVEIVFTQNSSCTWTTEYYDSFSSPAGERWRCSWMTPFTRRLLSYINLQNLCLWSMEGQKKWQIANIAVWVGYHAKMQNWWSEIRGKNPLKMLEKLGCEKYAMAKIMRVNMVLHTKKRLSLPAVLIVTFHAVCVYFTLWCVINCTVTYIILYKLRLDF
jgi:hypothetical protein